MSEKLEANQEIANLIASLDGEFGKKKKRGPTDADIARERNAAWHAANPQLGKAANTAKAQVERLKFENYYDWHTHRLAVEANAVEQYHGNVEGLLWIPDARITYIINQRCALCAGTTQFIGNQYIRFHGPRRKYKDIEGKEHEHIRTQVIQLRDCDKNLLAFGLPDGSPLPDLIEELDETVPQCVGCLRLEMTALDLWVKATQPTPQLPLFEQLDKPRKTLSGAELQALVSRDFGTKMVKPKLSTELQIPGIDN